jgi:hypothetical protein
MTYPWWDKRTPATRPRPDPSHVVTFTEPMQVMAVRIALERMAYNDEIPDGYVTPAAGEERRFQTELQGVAGEMTFALVYDLPAPRSDARDDGTDYLGCIDVKGRPYREFLLLPTNCLPRPGVRYYLAHITTRATLFGDAELVPSSGELIGWATGDEMKDVDVQECFPDGSGRRWPKACRAVWWEHLHGIAEGAEYVLEKRREWEAQRAQDLLRHRREG